VSQVNGTVHKTVRAIMCLKIQVSSVSFSGAKIPRINWEIFQSNDPLFFWPNRLQKTPFRANEKARLTRRLMSSIREVV